MSDPKIRGVIHVIEPTKTIGQKGFRKRLVVLEQSGGRFTNYVPVEFTNDGCDSINDLHLGDEIEVAYRLSGRKWQKDQQSEVKFFLSAEATGFSIVRSKGGGGRGASSSDDVNAAFDESAAGDDDAPF